MKYHAGILDGEAKWDPLELIVLGLTPGVPLEWVYAGAKLGWRRRANLLGLIDANRSDEILEMARDNAASVAEGDGLKMLEAVCPRYSGPAPLWSQIELQNDVRSNGAIARELGVHVDKVRRWRTKAVFDPLTGVRRVPNRGRSIVTT